MAISVAIRHLQPTTASESALGLQTCKYNARYITETGRLARIAIGTARHMLFSLLCWQLLSIRS